MANRGPEHPELRRRVDATLAETANLTTVVSSARTYAQQKALFEAWKAGHGNLAADPDRLNPVTGRRGSNHQVQNDGRSYAVDISVSPKTAENKARLERIANGNGLIRTVPSEYWHFEMMGTDGRAHRFGDPIGQWAGRVLCRGAQGSQVEHIQILLAEQGLLSEDDIVGAFGSKTEQAVRSWQARLGAPQTGCWDAATEAATDSALAGLGPGGPDEDEEIEMLLISCTNKTVLLLSGGKLAGIRDQTNLKEFLDAGIRLVNVSEAQYSVIEQSFG